MTALPIEQRIIPVPGKGQHPLTEADYLAQWDEAKIALAEANEALPAREAEVKRLDIEQAALRQALVDEWDNPTAWGKLETAYRAAELRYALAPIALKQLQDRQRALMLTCDRLARYVGSFEHERIAIAEKAKADAERAKADAVEAAKRQRKQLASLTPEERAARAAEKTAAVEQAEQAHHRQAQRQARAAEDVQLKAAMLDRVKQILNPEKPKGR